MIFFSCIETLQEATSRLQNRRKISVNFYFRISQKSVAERQRKSIFMLFQTFLERIFSIHSYGENHRLKEICMFWEYCNSHFILFQELEMQNNPIYSGTNDKDNMNLSKRAGSSSLWRTKGIRKRNLTNLVFIG